MCSTPPGSRSALPPAVRIPAAVEKFQSPLWIFFFFEGFKHQQPCSGDRADAERLGRSQMLRGGCSEGARCQLGVPLACGFAVVCILFLGGPQSCQDDERLLAFSRRASQEAQNPAEGTRHSVPSPYEPLYNQAYVASSLKATCMRLPQ